MMLGMREREGQRSECLSAAGWDREAERPERRRRSRGRGSDLRLSDRPCAASARRDRFDSRARHDDRLVQMRSPGRPDPAFAPREWLLPRSDRVARPRHLRYGPRSHWPRGSSFESRRRTSRDHARGPRAARSRRSRAERRSALRPRRRRANDRGVHARVPPASGEQALPCSSLGPPEVAPHQAATSTRVPDLTVFEDRPRRALVCLRRDPKPPTPARSRAARPCRRLDHRTFLAARMSSRVEPAGSRLPGSLRAWSLSGSSHPVPIAVPVLVPVSRPETRRAPPLLRRRQTCAPSPHGP